MGIIKAVQDNPYRILGVYSNSPIRERIANNNRMKAFLKIGKSVDFPLDLKSFISSPIRTTESVAQAESALTLPKEQVKHAQFWFVKKSPIDEIAFNHLVAGNREGALNIWNRKNDVSSLQNRIVCYLLTENYRLVLQLAEILYDHFSDSFVKMILGEDVVFDTNRLAYDFLDVLCSEISVNTIIPLITKEEWQMYLNKKAVDPLVTKIQMSITSAHETKNKDGNIRLKAGKKLQRETKQPLAELKRLIPASDLRYQMVADKLGLEILQCAIDYYNDSEEPNAAYEAMELQSYASSVVVGQMAKDRCKENVNILRKIISELPPQEVFAEDKAIKEELRKFCNLPDKICHAVTLLNNTKPHLQSIKNKLGASNSYYLKISTQVVGNALHNLIEEVNTVQSPETITIGEQTIEIPVTLMSDKDRNAKIN